MKIIRGFTLLWYLLAAAFGMLAATEDSKAHTYVEQAQQMEQKYGLQPNLLVSICVKESNWQNRRGTHGEIGVCQIKPESLRNALGSPTGADHPVLRLGARGNYVKTAQLLTGAENDGIYGPKTAFMVGIYQSEHKLHVDGIVGPKTWASLLGKPNYAVLLWNQSMNIEYAARYLVWLRNKLGTDNPMILMAAYNGGPGNQIVKYMVSVEKYRLSMQPIVESSLAEEYRQ